MGHDVTTDYVLSGQGNKRTEIIAGRQQQVQAWNEWCIEINSARRAEIITLIKEQNFELYCLLSDDPGKSQSFFDALGISLQTEIQKKQQDVRAIEFEFEGHKIFLNDLVPPGTSTDIEHYYWCSEP